MDAWTAAARRVLIATLPLPMTAATGAAVLTGGWTSAQSVAVLIGVLGAGAAAVTTLLRAPRAATVVLAPALLVASVVLPTLGNAPLPAHARLIDIAATYASAAVTGLSGNAPWAFNVGLGALLWACGAWAVVMSLTARRGVLASLPVWTVVAVNAINSPTPAAASLCSFSAVALSLLLIAAVNLERLGASWSRRGLVILPGTTGRFAVAVAGASLLVLIVAGLAPALSSTDISGRFFGGGGDGSGRGDTGSGRGTGSTVAYSRATIPGGALIERSTPELLYTSSDGGGAYLQMATDSVFSAGAWLPYADGQGNLAIDVSPPGPLVRDRLVDDGGVGTATRAVTADIRISHDASGNGTIPFPGEPEASSVAVQLAGAPAPIGSNGIVSVDSATALQPLTSRTITTTGTVSTATVGQLRTAGTAYPEFIRDGGFLALPDDSTGGAATIAALAAQWTASAATPYDRAAAIEDHLRDPALFSYTLTPRLPPAGMAVWPLVYFLTTTHAGYCQYFASAMGALLRAAGIPSRLVNGYGPGTLLPAPPGSRAPSLTRAVTSNDAHTWVEAYFPAYGWVPFEPTPPSAQGNYQPFTRGNSTAATPSAASSTPRGAGGHGAGPGENLTGGGGHSTSSSVAPPILDGAGIGLGTLLVAVVTWALLPRGVAGVWRRLALVARIGGIRRDRAATYGETAAG
ncbi:MAG: transglutaminase-like domain-containing protein, partial [Candidatus Dormibacteria bacterium]